MAHMVSRLLQRLSCRSSSHSLLQAARQQGTSAATVVLTWCTGEAQLSLRLLSLRLHRLNCQRASFGLAPGGMAHVRLFCHD